MDLGTQNSLTGFLLCCDRTWNAEFYFWSGHLMYLSHAARAPRETQKPLAREERSEQGVEPGPGHSLPAPSAWVIREQAGGSVAQLADRVTLPSWKGLYFTVFFKKCKTFYPLNTIGPFLPHLFLMQFGISKGNNDVYFEILIWQLIGSRDQSSVLFVMICKMRINSKDPGGRHPGKIK